MSPRGDDDNNTTTTTTRNTRQAFGARDFYRTYIPLQVQPLSPPATSSVTRLISVKLLLLLLLLLLKVHPGHNPPGTVPPGRATCASTSSTTLHDPRTIWAMPAQFVGLAGRAGVRGNGGVLGLPGRYHELHGASLAVPCHEPIKPPPFLISAG